MRISCLLSVMTYLLAAVDGLPQQPIELDQGPPPVNAITMGEAAEADQQAKVDEARNKAWIRGLLVGGGAIGAASYLMKTRKYQLLQDQLTCIKNSLETVDKESHEVLMDIIADVTAKGRIDWPTIARKDPEKMDIYWACTEKSGLGPSLRKDTKRLSRTLSRGRDSWGQQHLEGVQAWNEKHRQRKEERSKFNLPREGIHLKHPDSHTPESQPAAQPDGNSKGQAASPGGQPTAEQKPTTEHKMVTSQGQTVTSPGQQTAKQATEQPAAQPVGQRQGVSGQSNPRVKALIRTVRVDENGHEVESPVREAATNQGSRPQTEEERRRATWNQQQEQLRKQRELQEQHQTYRETPGQATTGNKPPSKPPVERPKKNGVPIPVRRPVESTNNVGALNDAESLNPQSSERRTKPMKPNGNSPPRQGGSNTRPDNTNNNPNLNTIVGQPPPAVGSGPLAHIEDKLDRLGLQAKPYMKEGIDNTGLLMQQLGDGVKKQATGLLNGRPVGVPFGAPPAPGGVGAPAGLRLPMLPGR